LIEAVGLKARIEGRAQISTRHANFIVNLGQARAADVYELMRLAQETVFQRFGVWLRPEIERFGRWSGAARAALQGPAST
jgi:UDP-N-acetylmuramate dehydrogenase